MKAIHRPRRLAALGILGLSAAVTIAAPSAASTPTPTVTEVSLSPSYVVAGTPASAALALTASSPFTARAVGVAVRDSRGNNYDYPGAATNVGLGTSTYKFASATRTFTAGTYTVYGFWQDSSGVYHSLPATTLTVGPATTTGVAATSLTPGYVTGGASVAATLALASSSAVTAQAVGVAVRDSNGAQYDFPGAATNVALGRTTYTFNSGTRTFAPGAYTAFGFWEDSSGVYHHVGSTALTVGAPLPSAPPPPPPPPATPAPNGMPGAWNIKLDDGFNGTSLTAAIWQPGWFGAQVTNPVAPTEQDCYDAKNVTFPGDGSVHLKVTAAASTCGGKTEPYTGSLLSSNPSDGRLSGGFQYTYGALEARVYIPASGAKVANWPAVWTDGQTWPTDGEDDVMEGLSGQTCFHFHSPSGGPGGCVAGTGAGWHTFASDWEPGSTTFYYDGVQVGQITTGITSAPMYLVLSNTVSAAMGGPTVAPADMQVDYVRVWQH